MQHIFHKGCLSILETDVSKSTSLSDAMHIPNEAAKPTENGSYGEGKWQGERKEFLFLRKPHIAIWHFKFQTFEHLNHFNTDLKIKQKNIAAETKNVFKTTTGRSATTENQANAMEDKLKKSHTCLY